MNDCSDYLCLARRLVFPPAGAKTRVKLRFVARDRRFATRVLLPVAIRRSMQEAVRCRGYGSNWQPMQARGRGDGTSRAKKCFARCGLLGLGISTIDEYIDSDMFAMACAEDRPVTVSTHLAFALQPAFLRQPCRTYMGGMRCMGPLLSAIVTPTCW